MGSYIPQFGLGGIEVSNMSPVFASSAMQKTSMFMQEPLKPMQASMANGQQVWFQGPSMANGQVAFRPAAMQQQAQPQTQTQSFAVLNNPQSAAVPQQPVTIVKQQAAPKAVRLVQVAAATNSMQLQTQPQQLVVSLNGNGTLQQWGRQNGAVYLLNDAASAPLAGNMVQLQRQQVQPAGQKYAPQQAMTVTMGARPQAGPMHPNGHIMQLPNGQFQQQTQTAAAAAAAPAGGQQQVLMQQQVLPGPRLMQVPVNQAHVRAPALPQARPAMTVAMPAGSTNSQVRQPMMVVMQQQRITGGPPLLQQTSSPTTLTTAAQPNGMVVVSGAAAPRPLVAVPMQHQVPGGAGAAPRPVAQQQPITAQQMVHPQMQQVVHPQMQQSSAGFNTMQGQLRPAAAGTAGVVMITNSAAGQQAASAQAFRPAVAAGANIFVSGTSVSSTTASLMNKAAAGPESAGFNTQHMQLVMPVNGGTASQPMPVLNLGQQQHNHGAVPGAGGELSSPPPAPPITPGVAAAPTNAAATASHLLPQLTTSTSTNRSIMGGQSPSHGVIGGQCKSSRDGAAFSRSGTAPPAAASPTGSAPGSQPGTPARVNNASSNSACGDAGSGKEAVMRLVARSFIETGISLQQALTMIQPADRDLLAAAFKAAAEPAGPPAVSSSAAAALNGLSWLADVQINMPPVAKAAGGLGGDSGSLALSGSGHKDEDDAKDSTSTNMGSWGFSLFQTG